MSDQIPLEETSSIIPALKLEVLVSLPFPNTFIFQTAQSLINLFKGTHAKLLTQTLAFIDYWSINLISFFFTLKLKKVYGCVEVGSGGGD